MPKKVKTVFHRSNICAGPVRDRCAPAQVVAAGRCRRRALFSFEMIGAHKSADLCVASLRSVRVYETSCVHHNAMQSGRSKHEPPRRFTPHPHQFPFVDAPLGDVVFLTAGANLS
ncbi:hypothetical protein EVAR_11807_1 [Eumeta japonica]|uniref:Uncharacterized protein n=1 Tax=Eumeta variegata TaxID=151549 RepID=A0A4C1UPJ0_EUMVA|nr:hypothetical protein EVAR_11807_1 [Eumeta japonica]